MEVVASAEAAAALAGMFLEIVRTMKHVIETMKGARLALFEVFTRAERIRLNLELFRSLTNRLSDPMEKSTALSFNESAYRQTVNEVLELVRKVAGLAKRHDLLLKISWLFYRSDVAALVKKLEERERDLGLVLTFIAARSQDSESVTSFRESPWSEHSSPTLWLGVLVREPFAPVYLEKLDKLVHAAKYGDWSTVLESLDEGRSVFNESWSNAVRLRTLATGRTKGEFQCADITAAEIARELGYDDIYDILAPVVRHVLPAATLTLLQRKFDEFLQAELEECVTLTRGEIRLPPLSAFTKLERPEMWFPLALFQKGFLIRLDGRELVVLSLGRRQPPSRQVFRITTKGWTAIQDVIITGH
ncbi:hypothetical protein P168DRAFT_300151 [Aspergillus campestris IBT 28561]|uniref:Uncharacterized protein n=1 Tax=Aspergillus campestris (strain IBT 28561) TaxID=1392248 RepID=A0A2I1CRY4_ASPC2|nr:uncharacterized protein P168DRAFT_300151 [Aspergillus campestris IBT 28561]PKY00375.1 hypothetical protein P168DRAFT_300151 [Aspergillus campestris IBT 28561]